MSEKIDVTSGNPYRDESGHFGTSPDEKLKASIAALRGAKLVSHDDNKKKIASAKKDAKAKLAALRGKNDSSSGTLLSTMTPDDGKEFDDEQKMKDYISGYHTGDMSDDEVQALDHWALTVESMEIQDAARGKNKDEAPNKDLKTIDGLTNKNSLKEDLNLYRGMGLTQEELDKIASNKQFKTKTFFATGLNPKRIESLFLGSKYRFAEENRDERKPVLFRIKAKKGTKGVFVDSRFDSTADYRKLGEFLPSRDTSYKVNNVTYQKNEDGSLKGATVEMEVE